MKRSAVSTSSSSKNNSKRRKTEEEEEEDSKATANSSRSSTSGEMKRALCELTVHKKVGFARAATLSLPRNTVRTPVFMPVGTQGVIKGLTSKQVADIGFEIILANTYHLGLRPGTKLLARKGGLHNYMNWSRNLLTDSGGFQMVSLFDLAEFTEEGVTFQSPVDGSLMLLSPEKSIELQNEIGSDIMMMLDDVVSSVRNDEARFEEATHRTIRWLDRCIAAHNRPAEQNLFAIVQGGLNPELRNHCVDEFLKRDKDLPGYAIGGLAGGEDKAQFWRVVFHSAWRLPLNKPKYLMGVGYPLDLVVCVCLGVDMFDCVWPSRSARFGIALVPEGTMNLKKAIYAADDTPLDEKCTCLTCQRYTRAFLNGVVTREPTACHMLTVHNLTYMLRLMGEIRDAIMQNTLPQYVNDFLTTMFPTKQWPQWVEEALVASGVFQQTGLARQFPQYKFNQDAYFIRAGMTQGGQFDIAHQD